LNLFRQTLELVTFIQLRLREKKELIMICISDISCVLIARKCHIFFYGY